MAAHPLILANMTRWFRTLTGYLASWFRSPPPTANRSRLMGMYLSQSNSREGNHSLLRRNRERSDGKFAQNRRRD